MFTNFSDDELNLLQYVFTRFCVDHPLYMDDDMVIMGIAIEREVMKRVLDAGVPVPGTDDLSMDQDV